jgi:hypothetical protein
MPSMVATDAAKSGGGLPLSLPPRRERRLPRKRKPRLSGVFVVADARTRTGDPFITSEVLYQLSYVGEGVSV